MGRIYSALDLYSLPDPAFASPDSGGSRVQATAEHLQQLTIFYNGRVSVCKVTENQARAILHLAQQEIKESSQKAREIVSCVNQSKMLPLNQEPKLHHGLFMKKSLQRFLQKRKSRIQASTPYNQ